MSEQATNRYKTEAARYLYRTVLYDEEHRPLPSDRTPEMLLERVRDQLDFAEELVDQYERGGYEVADLTVLAVRFMWLGASALAAAAHVHADGTFAPTGFKDDLLELIDGNVAESIGRWDGDPLPPRELLEDCSLLLHEAAERVEIGSAEDELEDAAVSFTNVANSATIAVAQIERRRFQG